MSDSRQALIDVIENDDREAAASLFEDSELRQQINEGLFPWNMPPLAAAKSREMMDVLIANGAEPAQVARWWAPGFGASQVSPDIARHLIDLGTVISIHAAVAIGLLDVVESTLKNTPSSARAKGGDGCHPLHFCTNIEVARLLLEHGAELDARDEDHDSTPIQWRIKDAPELVEFLVEQGATVDIFMAAALGDVARTKRWLAAEPDCSQWRIGYNSGPFPGIGFQGRGGTIYQWTLGFNLTPHEVALRRGHSDVYDLLMEATPPKAKLLVACTTANRTLAESIIAEHPDALNSLDDEEQQLLAKFCWETNKSIEAVRLMLDVGMPVGSRESNHGYAALHNAAWCGDPELVQLLLDRGHPVDWRDPEYNGTAVGWALQSCLVAKRHPDGKFPEVIDMLLGAGVPFEGKESVGHEEIDAVLRRYK